uniref:NADH-ubiquinone oxidoreductase chain 4 n=1 Tax=Paramblynotus sp. ZJUH 20220012 TaxID=2943458 RepID=A0A9E8G7I2_9HYME|nr:NADH dehydrogenase subunit 4 [Paramblynotus sp. ZJUH 20220012]
MMINYFMLIFSIFLLNFINKKLLMIYFQNIILIMFLIYLILNKIMFFSMKFYHFLFIDYYSFYLMLLIFWIMSLMFMSMIKMKFKKLYILNLLLLLLFLLMTFNSLNYFMFYLFFEISMIPTLLLIVGWGGQFERIEASLYMFMYTLFGSLPMMIIILKIYYMNFSLNIIMLNNLILINNIYMYMYMLLAFLIKIPMFFFHLWLPKAHVEAPISGSMILASIMLKLGSYGILRTMMIMESICLKFNYMIMSISLMGSMFISLICIQQIDMKIIIAYSSVVHMGMLLSSLLTMNLLGNFGSLMMMIAHGLCSSNLFCLLNLYYERLKSRSIYLNKGMMNLFPSLSFFWFMICIFNMASPPSLNMFSEILMINSLLNYSFQFIYLLMILSFFNIVYMMYFYSKIQHGTLYKNLNLFMFISMREYLLMFLHLIMLFYLILMF